MTDPTPPTDEPPTGFTSGGTPPDVANLTFDDALAELQRTIAALETGGQPLERTLELHERGAALLAHCEALLRGAELRMRQLVAGRSGPETVEVGPDRAVDEA